MGEDRGQNPVPGHILAGGETSGATVAPDTIPVHPQPYLHPQSFLELNKKLGLCDNNFLRAVLCPPGETAEEEGQKDF